MNLSVRGHGSMVSATTHSAAVKGLLHVAVQPLIAGLRFPPLLRGPSPAGPAPPGSPGRTRRAPERTRPQEKWGKKTLLDLPPPGGSAPRRLAAPRANRRPPRVAAATRPSAQKAKGEASRRWRGASPPPPGGMFHLTRSARQPPSSSARGTHHCHFLILETGWADAEVRF